MSCKRATILNKVTSSLFRIQIQVIQVSCPLIDWSSTFCLCPKFQSLITISMTTINLRSFSQVKGRANNTETALLTASNDLLLASTGGFLSVLLLNISAVFISWPQYYTEKIRESYWHQGSNLKLGKVLIFLICFNLYITKITRTCAG